MEDQSIAHLAELKDRVSRDDYRVDPAAVAEAMLRRPEVRRLLLAPRYALGALASSPNHSTRTIFPPRRV